MPSYSSGDDPLPPPQSGEEGSSSGDPSAAIAPRAAPPPSSSKPPMEDEEAQLWETKVREDQQDYVDFPRWRKFRTQLPSICDVLLSGWCSCQQTNGLCRNDYELYLLKIMNIGYALFGPPVQEGCGENSIEGMGYSEGQLKQIEDIFKTIMKHRRNQTSSEVLYAPVFIFVRSVDGQEKKVPVFRIPDPHTSEHPPEKYWFIDESCRTYCDWNDYLQNNELPKGRFCFPENGVYPGDSLEENKQVKSDIMETPASSVLKAVATGMDIGATVAGVGLGVISVIGAFTPLGAVVGTGCAIGAGVSGGYSIVRSSMNLADRGNHGQSIGLKDRSSRRDWMGIAGSVLGLGAVGGAVTVAKLTQNGRVVSSIGAHIVDGLNFSSALVNGAGIVDEIVDLTKRDDDVSAVECVQVAVSVVFFCHSVVSMKSAFTVIEESRAQKINATKNGLTSNRRKKMFEGVVRETMKGQSKAAGEAQVIRGINHESNVDEALAKILRSKKSCKADGCKFSFTDSGIVKKTAKRVPSKSTSWRCASGVGTSRAHYKTPFLPPQAQPRIPMNSEGGSSYISVLIDDLMEVLLAFLKSEPVIRLIMEKLKALCERIPYGKAIHKCISLVVQFRNCKTSKDYVQWASIFLEELKSVFEHSIEMLQRQREENEVLKDAMDKALCTSLIHAGHENTYSSNSVVLREEEPYHFPEHLGWDAEGNLKLEQYRRIAENTLGASIEGTENIYCTGKTALVPVQGKGIVEITSHVKHRTIIVTKYSFPED